MYLSIPIVLPCDCSSPKNKTLWLLLGLPHYEATTLKPVTRDATWMWRVPLSVPLLRSVRRVAAPGCRKMLVACNNDNSVPFRLCRASAPSQGIRRDLNYLGASKSLLRFEVFEFDERYLSWDDSQLANSLWVFGWNLLFFAVKMGVPGRPAPIEKKPHRSQKMPRKWLLTQWLARRDFATWVGTAPFRKTRSSVLKADSRLALGDENMLGFSPRHITQMVVEWVQDC